MGRRQPEALAYSLAGRAVIAALLGLDVYDAWQVGRYADASITVPPSRLGLEAEVTAYYAGCEAERRWAEQASMALPEGPTEFELRAQIILEQLGGGAEPRLRKLAAALVAEKWSAIQAVAETLLGPRQSISGDEIVELILEAQK